jgi:O-antigen/teichoic acid export membrane protein
MSLKLAIVKNTAMQVAGKLVGTAVGIITVGVMTRALGAEGYGAFTTALTFLQFFGILVDFGLTLTMAKLLAEPGADESKVASNILTLRLSSAFVLFGLAPFLALAFPYGPDVKQAITIGTVSFFAMTGAQALGGLFQKKLATGWVAIAEVAGRIALLLGTLSAAQEGAGLVAYVWALVIGNLTQFVIAFIAAGRLVPLRPAFDMALWKRIILESWPIGVSIAFNLIYLKGDVLVLSLFRPDAEIGLYGAAYKVLDVITVIPMIFMGLVLPVLASSWTAGRREEFERRLKTSFDAMSLMAIPLAIGAWVVGTDLMALVAGPEFAGSGRYLAILMLAGAAVFWSGLFGHAVVAIGMQKRMIVAYAVDAVLSLALYFTLIPRYGADAAAWVTVFAEGLIAVLCAIAVLSVTGIRPALRTTLMAFVASAAMAAALVAIPNVHVLFRIIIGGAIYTTILITTGVAKNVIPGLTRDPQART